MKDHLSVRGAGGKGQERKFKRQSRVPGSFSLQSLLGQQCSDYTSKVLYTTPPNAVHGKQGMVSSGTLSCHLRPFSQRRWKLKKQTKEEKNPKAYFRPKRAQERSNPQQEQKSARVFEVEQSSFITYRWLKSFVGFKNLLVLVSVQKVRKQ